MRESYENVVCQAALEQWYDIENVAVEGTLSLQNL